MNQAISYGGRRWKRQHRNISTYGVHASRNVAAAKQGKTRASRSELIDEPRPIVNSPPLSKRRKLIQTETVC